MSDQVGGAANVNEASGDEGNKGSESQTDKVAYDTYRRVLAEKKKVQAELSEKNARLAEFEAEQEAVTKAKLVSEGKFTEALELERRKAKELEEKLNYREKEREDMYKMSAFIGALDGTIERQYLGMLTPIVREKVKFDAEGGTVDEMSVTDTVKFVRETYPALVMRPASGTGLPSAAPKTDEGDLTYEKWCAMSPADQKKYLPSLYAKENNK